MMRRRLGYESVPYLPLSMLKESLPERPKSACERGKWPLVHQIVLKISLKNRFFLLDSKNKGGLLCAAGGKKWPKVGLVEQLAPSH